MPEPRIRAAGASDLPAVVRLTEAAYGQYLAILGAPPLPVTENYAPRIARGEVRLLEVGEDLAGLIVLEQEADHLMIFSVAVAPKHQGQGFGTALLDYAEREARSVGLPEVRLYTNAKMERNIAIYTAHGYRETGRRPNPRRPGFTIVDMVKPLLAPTEAGSALPK